MKPVQKKIANNLLVVAKQYLSEFDPDSGPIGSGPCLNLFKAWKDYFQAFEDMCQVQNVPEQNEKSLFLLLAGMKFRARLNEILSGSENAPNDLSEIVTIMEDYFRNKATLQGLRYDFFYGIDSKPDFKVETQFEWISVSSQLKFFDSTDLKSVVRNRLDLSRFSTWNRLGNYVEEYYTQKLREINVLPATVLD